MKIQRVHYLLGYLGLIPFVGLAALQVAGVVNSNIYLLSYSALILSFLGGTLWSSSITLKLDWPVAVVSNLVVLFAWAALVFHQTPAVLGLMALLLIGLLVFEHIQLGRLYHSSLMRLRNILTIGSSASLVYAALFASG